MKLESEEYFQDEDFLRILYQYEESMRTKGSVYMEAEDLTDIAEYYMCNNQEEKANEAISLAMGLHPDSVDPQVFMARQAMFNNQMEEAHHICERIKNQDDHEVIFIHAELTIREGKAEEALKQLMQAYEHIEEDRNHFLYDCCCIFMDYGCWKEALRLICLFEKKYPGDKRITQLKAETYSAMGEYETALPLMEKITNDEPYNLSGWNMLAEAYCQMERFVEAIDAAEYALCIQPNDKRALITKANCYFYLNMMDKAHELYKHLIELYPEDDIILFLCAVSYASQNDYKEARRLLRKADRVAEGMSHEQLQIYLQLSFVESKLHNIEQAMEYLDKAMTLADDNHHIDYHILRANIYLENGRLTDAEEAFRKALAESKDKRATKVNIGIIHAEVGDYSHAASLLQTVVDSDMASGTSSDAIPYLAYCYFKLDDIQQFLKYLKLSSMVNREMTINLFQEYYPNIQPEEYYLYAYKQIYGLYPTDSK